MPRMITVLEDCVRYRDGKKWKRRQCFISKSDSKRGSVTMFITKQFGISVTNQEIDEKSLRQYLIDEITGFEHGRHVDKESHVMALIGCNVVYCIAFEQTDTMFRWAETLNKLLTSVHFHVTLKKVSDTSAVFNKINVGTQGNLHVQQRRLCLIAEPADGNKFICEWSIGNLISLDIHDTNCDKIKRLQIKSNGKSNKGKGHFEFEVSLTQISIFETALQTFLKTCSASNNDFTTNYILSPHCNGTNEDTAYSYSIICNEKTGNNSENSSSIEKRSSEIPIPRSREHSGPDQRPIENVQVKMRMLQKNVQKHYSTIGAVSKHDNDGCLFPDDEEIEDLGQHKSQNPLLRCLSQESSGVCVSGPSDSLKDVDLSVHISIHDDSGYDNVSINPRQSTSSCLHHDLDHNILPQCRKKRCQKMSVFFAFYRDVCRHPLSLSNYGKYHRLLKTIFDRNNQALKRSNSFNCVHVPNMKRFEFCRKYSNVNFPLNVASKSKCWREKISRDNIEEAFMGLDFTPDMEDVPELLLSSRLPFRSMKEFHSVMMRSLQSGTVCFNMFSYHHFLSLLNDTRTVINNIEANKLVSSNAALEYRNLKDLICRKSKVYNHWLERIQSYCSSCDGVEPSIIDVNILLVFQIMDSVVHSRSGLSHGLSGDIYRQQKYFDTNQTDVNTEQLSPNYVTHNSAYIAGTRPLLSMSTSTPDFRHYSHHERVHKLSNIETRYQNLSSLDTFDVDNNSFSKYNNYLNKTATLDHKEGSFKRFRRKCSPNVFMPLIRRKTSSVHSTVSEPICNHETKEQNLYYNISSNQNNISKKSLSVVLDSCQYVNVSQSSRSSKVNKGSENKNQSTDYSDYANLDPSLCDDNTNYPEEIMDPSRNYGDLNFIKGRMRFSTRHNSDSQNCTNFRRSSLSVISQKSLQNYGTSSQSKRGNSTAISRVHSDACHDTGSRFRSTDYINTKALSTSPLSLQSCCASTSKQQTVPRSLNYVTVVENTSGDRWTSPLQVLTNHDLDSDFNHNHDHGTSHRPPHGKRTWLTPQSSPIVDYCQIDLNGTYALREIDRKLRDKKSGPVQPPTLSNDALMLRSFPSLEHIPCDMYHSLTRPPRHKTKYASTKSIRRIFSRKCPDTTN